MRTPTLVTALLGFALAGLAPAQTTVTQSAPATTPAAVTDGSTPAPQVQADVYRPQFKGDPAHSHAEAAALGYLRTVLDAQRAYKKRHANWATSLAGLVNSGSFTKRMVSTDRHDYTATFKPGWSLQLTPKQFDINHRAFFVDGTGTIRVDDAKPATADSPVAKAER